MPTKSAEKPPKISDLYPPASAARLVGIGKTTLDSAITAGHCACHRLATGQAVVTLAQVRAWLENRPKRGRKPKPTE